jgi:hypothetical protein
MATESEVVAKLQKELNDVKAQIRTLNEKKKKGAISPIEGMQLNNLGKMQNELISKLKHYM